MKLTKGVFTDLPENKSPAGTWRGAKNKVFKSGVLINEPGVEELNTFMDFTPIGDLLLPDNSLLFFTVDSANTSKISRIKNGVKSDVTSFDFEFNRSYPVRAEAKYTNDLDIEVVFTDNRLPPRLITIDKTSGVIQEDQIEDTLLFPSIRVPNFELVEVGGGGNLKKGSYQVSIAYKFLDGGYTNYVGLSNPIVVKTNGGSVGIKITNVDTSFSAFKVGLLGNNNGVTLFEETINDLSVISTEKSITLIGGGRDMPLESILVKSKSYNRVADWTVVDGMLLGANVSSDPSIDYQTQANGIKIEPVWIDAVALDTVEGSYQDPKVIYDKKGFPNQEVMSFYIRWIGTDGVPKGDFHIPRGVGASTMDTHQNQNENYPAGKGYPETGGVGDKVTHHKFPKTAAADFLITPSSGQALTASAITPSLIDNYDGGGNHAVAFGSFSGAYGTFANSFEFPALTYTMWSLAGDRDVDVSVDLTITTGSGATGGQIWVNVDILDASNGFVDTVIARSRTFAASEVITISDFGIANLLDGQKIYVTMWIQTGDVVGQFTVTNATYTVTESNSGFAGGAKYFTKPMGIKLSNIVIPQALLGKVQGFEIMYARRTAANSSVVAQDIVYPRAWQGSNIGDRGRLHDFGLLLDKPNVTPNKMRGQYTLDELSASLSYKYTNNTPVSVVVDRNIASSKYVPHDNIAANNEEGEEYFEISLETTYDPTSGKRLLANIINERDDYYLSFDTQVLVSTGKVFLIPESTINPPQGWVWAGNQWTVTIDKLYGGDTYTSFNKVRLTRNVVDASEKDLALQVASIKVAEIPVQSKYNSSLREWGIAWYEKEPNFYPPRQELVAAGIHQDVSDNTSNEAYALGYKLSKEHTTYHELDRGFLNENDKILVTIQGDKITDHPHRIIKTLPQNKESDISSWRQFKPLDYYEQNKDRGEIVNLATFDTDKVIIHHERGLFMTSGKEKLATDVSEIFIGSGEVFERDPKEPIYSEEGFLGTSHKFFNKTTPLGYLFESDNRIYLLGKTLEEITKKGVRFDFDALLEGVGDNPYIQDETDPQFVGGMSASYDKKYERILVSVNKANASTCFSFAKDIGAWVSEHSSTNNKFVDTSKDFYAISNKKFFRHNTGNKCVYYNGVPQDSWITASFVFEEDVTKLYTNMMWNTTVKNSSGVVLPNETFSKIHFWNSKNDSGERDLIRLNGLTNAHNLRKAFNIWRYRELRMQALNYEDRKKMIDDYLTVKLIFDNSNNYEIVISELEPSFRILNI